MHISKIKKRTIEKEQEIRNKKELKRGKTRENEPKVDLTAKNVTDKKEKEGKKKNLYRVAMNNARQMKTAPTSSEDEVTQLLEERTTTKTKAVKKKTPKETVPPEQQGLRKVPVPSDKFGCKHCGINDMKQMDQSYCKYYLQDQRWLVGKTCIDCKKGVQEFVEATNKKEKIKLYYCHHGIAAANMGEEEEFKKLLACDTVYCTPCYKKQVDGMETDNRSNGRSSRRSRSSNSALH